VGSDLPLGTQIIWLRSVVKFDEVNAYSYSIDGKIFTPFGGFYKLHGAGFRGDFIGIYCFNDTGDTGYVDVQGFAYTTRNRPASTEPGG
jgi:hypothetical protein